MVLSSIPVYFTSEMLETCGRVDDIVAKTDRGSPGCTIYGGKYVRIQHDACTAG